MRVLLLALAALALAACGDNRNPGTPEPPADGAVAIDAGSDAGADAAIDAGAGAGPCLNHPDDLPRPPTGALPCELLPPGFPR